ncbi:GRAM domain [Dillenia turbinata]|uniref:GRAM domain n=1 Tax=Dillenia turbinata TaxID=194707 RepID=A0AAN8ZS06_9MAGN
METENYPNPKYDGSPLMGSSESSSEIHFSRSEPPSSLQSPTSSDSSPSFKSKEEEVRTNRIKRLGKKANSFAFRVRDHVKIGPKFSETVKGKMSLGANIIRKGGRENIFKHKFEVKEGEKLLKASQCYLSTTAGPIAGILFISNLKICFCSERPITVSSPSGDLIRTPYKVVIPVKKVKAANQSGNVEKPAQKYIEVVTEDGFEFWFMGFFRYEKAWKNLEKAISMSNTVLEEEADLSLSL